MIEYPYVDVSVSIWVNTFIAAALIDTGYDGAIIVPDELADEIDTPPSGDRLLMPDGREARALRWSGKLELAGATLPVDVKCFGTEWILGREVLDRYEVCFHFGEEVRISSAR